MTRRRGPRHVPALLAALLVCCAGTACAAPDDPALDGGPPGTGDLVVERYELDGDPVMGVSGRGRPVEALVVYLHGRGETSTATLDDPQLRVVTQALVEAGYAVVSSDAGGDSFGSPGAQGAYLRLAEAAREHYATDTTFLLAESMGGLAALPLAASGEVRDLRGTAAINPAISLTAPSVAAHGEAAAAAWGRVPGGADDPLLLPPHRLAGQHFRFYVTDGDDVVPTPEHAGALAERLEGVAEVSLVGCTGEHVDPSCFQAQDVVAWFDERR